VRLPNADQAEIDPRKVDYLHTAGKMKFFEMFGFDRSRPEELINALKDHPLRNVVERVVPASPHGVKYTIRCSIKSPDGRDPCALTVWIIDAGQSYPRFVSGYASPLAPQAFPTLS
jgi:hypothetical protein